MEILSSIAGFFGWKWLVVFTLMYVTGYFAAHNPHLRIFHASKNGMEKAARKLMDKARELRMGGKG